MREFSLILKLLNETSRSYSILRPPFEPIVLRVKPRKTWENRDEEKIAKRPRGPSHYRDVVRVNCAVNTRGGSNHENFTPLGGYPTQKVAPMVKCTRKGPNGTQKLKPNARRWRGNKIVDWYQKNCL